MRLHGKGLGFRRRLGVTTRTIIGGLSVLLIIAAVGCDDKSQPTGPTTARESPGTDVQTQQVATPTTTPTPQLPGSITPEPRPVSFDDHVMPPEYVRLDFDNQIVVAFVDDQGLGRVAYVTHVPTGAQAVLNNKGKVVERHSGTGNGDAILEVTLSDADAMSQIQGGFLYEEDLPGNGFMDWVNFIRFGGSEYLSKGKRGGGDQVEKSRLGEVLYRVAFHVDANLVPGDYRPRAGDAAFLSPGTAIHSVDGYSPSEVLAAVVDGEVWLFDRPGPAISIPTPAVVPGEPQIDRHEEAEQRLRRAMANFPAGHIDCLSGQGATLDVVHERARGS